MPIARLFDSNFPPAHDTYNGIAAASDGRIYYILSTASYDVGASLFRFDPRGETVETLADLSGNEGKTIPQGKSHVTPEEHEGKLYFATHVGVYSNLDGKEAMPVAPPGYQAYPGGRFLSFDMASGRIEDYGVAPGGEGVLAMALDGPRRRAYGITWPSGKFVVVNLETREARNLGRISEQGEAGVGASYRTLCRSPRVDPGNGDVWFTTSEGWLLRHAFDSFAFQRIEEDDLRKDYFGQYDAASPGHMGYNWRQTVWYEPEQAIYGVHGNSGYLFKFTPGARRVEVIARITSLPSQRAGMFDQFSYGYLGFTLGPDGETIYYLTGGPLYEKGRRVRGKDSTARGEAKGEENLHLVTFHIPTRRYKDHGAILMEDGQRPSYVNSIAVGADGAVYTLTRAEPTAEARTDLMRVEPV